jgi:DNA-binding Lrp family transcriptional regulator
MKAYIGVICKAGAYTEVLKRLLQLSIYQDDMFLLFGPVDILVRFTGLKSLDEFVEKWFNAVRMVGAEEDLITKTLSFVVISEGPLSNEKPFAFIFLNTQPKNLENVRESLLTIPEVLSADTVFGPYDVICSVSAKDHTDLAETVAKIQSVPGVESSLTSVVASIKILPEW